MNGLASDTQQTQSLLQSTDNSTVAADITGAGSTAISDSQSSLHDAPSSTDQHSTESNPVTPSPNEPIESALQSIPTNTGTESEGVRSAEVILEEQHKDGTSTGDIAVAESSDLKQEQDLIPVPVNAQIELLEHTPEPAGGEGEAGIVVQEDGQDWMPDSDHELKRVKVYELIGSRWIDQGTAFCFGQFSEENNEALLIARSERNYNEVILSTAIRSNDVYQRQQDTLIVWTEPDGVDYALSFQDPDGCAEVWNFILEVQKHMNATENLSPLLGPDISVTSSSIIRSGHLPPPQLGIISEIERAIKALSRTQTVKERICEYIQSEDYIKSLIKVMGDAEDLESLENLHALCSLMQTILMLNDHGLYEHILEDEIFYGVVGMLEYDPDFPGHKANYRDFLHNTAAFHQPIPMRDVTIKRKIHHTYRLQFLKDVVLARALDDSTFNVLNSCIIFNQIDIITYIQQDPNFLRDIVRLFVDEDMLLGTAGGPNGRRLQFQPQQAQPPVNPQPTAPQHMIISLNGNGDNSGRPDAAAMDVDPKSSPSFTSNAANASETAATPGTETGSPPANNGRSAKRTNCYAFAPPDDLTESEIALRREVVMLLQQLCVMGKNVQMPARIALFRTLVDRGVLFAVQWALTLPEKEETTKQMINTAGEVLSAVLDHDLLGVRSHVLRQVVAIEKERNAQKKGADKAETLIDIACRLLAKSKDLAIQSQIGDCLKVWTDLPPPDVLPPPAGTEIGPKLPPVIRKDDPTNEKFMEHFYREPITKLMQPMTDLPLWRNYTDPLLPLTREETNRFVYLCDLLHNFIQQHTFRSHSYVVTSDILPRVATLFKAKDKHLRHSSFRIFRLLLKQNNHYCLAHIMKHDIFKPILDLTLRESSRDNLLSCSCQEFFEHMRKENVKELIRFCMTRHEAEIQKLAQTPLGSQRFDLFIRRWDMNNAPPPEETTPDKSLDRGWGGPGRLLDLAEEDYFNAEDDDDDIIPSISQQSWLNNSPLSANNTGLKRKRRPGITAAPKGFRPPLRTPQLGPLVDYDEDDDEPNTSAIAGDVTPEASGSSTSPDSKPLASQIKRSPSPASTSSTLDSPLSSGPPPKRAASDANDEDNMLEALVRKTRARSESPLPSLGPMRPAEKRRRAEDDDDEMFARLAKTSKKSDLGDQKESATSIPGRAKNGDDPPGKKIKVKFGSIGLSVASIPATDTPTTTPGTDSPSEVSTKDGDTG